MRKLFPLFTILLIGSLMTSCISKKKHEEALAAAAAEKAALEKQLDDERTAKEKLQGELATLESNLNMSKQEITKLSEEIKLNQSRIEELKTSIINVFADYDKSDLNVREENGKLYITVNNSVLFNAGRDRVEKDAAETVDKLAAVFAKYGDLNVNVEGHTDNDPVKIHKGKYQDNWSLSVARATNVVRALEKAGIAAGRLTASGKGDTQPIASNDTKEGKAKNRRTEFVAYPNNKLSELYKQAQELKKGGDTN